ncbi:MAG: hypothetical protein IIW05_04355 [Paludibacteraceae bacterium]|nr:hypothetical protein [Paludibacteraceae bacterium]
MKTNIFYTWLPCVFTILVTILGFFLFFPSNPTALFYINLVYLIVLEGLFFGWFNIGKLESDRAQTPFFKVFIGVHTMYFLMISLIWMLLYTLFLSQSGHEWLSKLFETESIASWPVLSVRVYVLIIGVLAVIWMILASIVGRQDMAYHTQQTQLEENTIDLRAFRDELKHLAQQHATPQTERAWKQLIMEAESVPPKQFAQRYPQLREKANNLIR